MTTLVRAVGVWLQTRGGPRKAERDAELALENAAKTFFGK